MLRILSSRRFALWWHLAMDWFDTRFNAITAALPHEVSEDDIDELFESE